MTMGMGVKGREESSKIHNWRIWWMMNLLTSAQGTERKNSNLSFLRIEKQNVENNIYFTSSFEDLLKLSL